MKQIAKSFYIYAVWGVCRYYTACRLQVIRDEIGRASCRERV